MRADWIIAQNATSSLDFSVSDDVTSSDQLQVTASSSNPDLIPDSGILLAGTDEDRTLTVTPTSDQTGVALITLTITDDTGLSSDVIVPVTVVVPQSVVVEDPNLEAAIRLAVGRIRKNIATRQISTSEDATPIHKARLFSENFSNMAPTYQKEGVCALSVIRRRARPVRWSPG